MIKVSVEQTGNRNLSDVYQSGCEFSLAQAELAQVLGKPDQQIKHLKEALKFADLHVKSVQQRVDLGVADNQGFSADLLGKAIVRRADVKLALLRAIQKQKSP